MNETAILPSMRVDGQVALVTGAGRGIGRGCALALAEAGAEVIVMSRTEAEIISLAAEIEAKGGRARAIACDITDGDALAAAFDRIEKLDILINNAGTNVPMPFLEADVASLDLIVSLNIRAAFLVAQAAARIMDRQGGGVIIHMSSTFGKVGRPGSSVYSGTKHFIEGLTKSTAVELAPRNIRVVAVGPTAIVTPLLADRLSDPDYAVQLTSRIPMGRLGQVEDVVGTVVFLASPAAALITGTTIMVDGGWTAQ
ncbi:MAG: glucose 1-dehydrogenase [Rhodospirillaceae bacterium]|jgi:NAD(P)-dependent dehydrogenase (short-subunit alcohol dehydrogenase family)|nr:glucose 1-dehydrogenase [Rhodospirillaceae bacterium]MBT5894547.1 glucose 1-dehydrogenase [Rhodospirillaceae bacterium]MBT6426220.1 glucose 1-dehydrogenase [Rhodospirillaceae bacterium]MBT7759240.1 glucose 1-dehydrogenase [Rhodospirillaceae bacterium]